MNKESVLKSLFVSFKIFKPVHLWNMLRLEKYLAQLEKRGISPHSHQLPEVPLGAGACNKYQGWNENKTFRKGPPPSLDSPENNQVSLVLQ